MTFPRSAPAVLCAFLLASAASAGAQAAGSASRTARAILTRGSEAVKGVPGFGRNAFPAVQGEYRLGDAGPSITSARVWMTDEALYLAPAAWIPERAANRRAYRSVDAALLLFDRPFDLGGQGAEPRLWSVVVEIPPESSLPRAELERFLKAFLDRAAYFLSNARSRTDVSLPAVLEY